MQKRNPWRRIAATSSAMVFVLLVAASYRFVASRGTFASVEEKTPAACRIVAGIGDVAAMASDGKTTYVASRAGGLFTYIDGSLAKVSGAPKEFHPVALAVSADGKLQAVFARDDGAYSVADFETAPGKVTEVGRLTTDQITDPSAIAAIDGVRFYLVNKHTSRSVFGRWLDDAFLIPRADILYFDGLKFVKVAERLNAPSGLALAKDGSHLYVAQELPRNIVGFSRSEFMSTLDNAALRDLPAAPRQISMAPDGSLIVAAWVKKGEGAVYRVPVINGAPQTAELLYSVKGEEVSVAVEVAGHILIGSDKRFLDCRLVR